MCFANVNEELHRYSVVRTQFRGVRKARRGGVAQDVVLQVCTWYRYTPTGMYLHIENLTMHEWLMSFSSFFLFPSPVLFQNLLSLVSELLPIYIPGCLLSLPFQPIHVKPENEDQQNSSIISPTKPRYHIPNPKLRYHSDCITLRKRKRRKYRIANHCHREEQHQRNTERRERYEIYKSAQEAKEQYGFILSKSAPASPRHVHLRRRRVGLSQRRIHHGMAC